MTRKRRQYTYGRQTPKGTRGHSIIYKNPVPIVGRGCLCEDGTYKAECCDGSIQGQGIGNVSNCTGTYFVEDYIQCDYFE